MFTLAKGSNIIPPIKKNTLIHGGENQTVHFSFLHLASYLLHLEGRNIRSTWNTLFKFKTGNILIFA